MKTSVIEVHAMLSVLIVDEVERRIGEVPGVESVRTRLAGIRQPGKTAARGTPDAAAKPKPGEAPAAPANPQPDRKAAT